MEKELAEIVIDTPPIILAEVSQIEFHKINNQMGEYRSQQMNSLKRKRWLHLIKVQRRKRREAKRSKRKR